MQKGAQAYFSTHIATTDQGQLLLMLYDGALKFLAQAREKMLARDMAGKGVLISKTIDIVNELASSLNMERGGTLAENLNNLYFLCTARLLQANAKLDVAQLDSVVNILSGLRSAYAQIVATPEAQAAAAQIPARQNPQEAAMAKRNTPIMTQHAPGPPAAVGRLQAQAAYQSIHVDSSTGPSAPSPAASGPVEDAKIPENAPMPQTVPMPPAIGGLNRGMAAYGKVAVGG
jgi:flagellar protein FliS